MLTDVVAEVAWSDADRFFGPVAVGLAVSVVAGSNPDTA
jgi:hypothetical protein